MTSSDPVDSGVFTLLYCICAVSVVCNLFVIAVIWWSKRLRATTDLYLVNLAISDILAAGIAMPLKLANAAASDFYGGDAVCKIVMFIPMFTIMCCISTMVAISFDRYYAIVRLRTSTSRQVIIIIAGIWILSIATSAPQIYEYSVHETFVVEINKTANVCGSFGIAESFEMYYAIVILIVCYIVPLTVICACYGKLIHFIWKKSRTENLGHTPHGTIRQGQVSQVKVKILRMLIVVTSVFAALWLPYFVMFAIEEITDTDDISDVTWLHAFKTILVGLSTISNPVIYALFNAKFRQEVRAMLPFGAKVSPATSSVMVTSLPE